jgi:hypothetical protein
MKPLKAVTYEQVPSQFVPGGVDAGVVGVWRRSKRAKESAEVKSRFGMLKCTVMSMLKNSGDERRAHTKPL